jgi:hypothetical protein
VLASLVAQIGIATLEVSRYFDLSARARKKHLASLLSA